MSSPPVGTVFPCQDGVLLVPAVLPIHIPADAFGLTVAEWLNLQPSREVTP
ncbi:hypothetical protein [Nonomuraea basaltis]|uniref:hypothetical protein n=1 Tax=Nonomuraea basaltis TaxID=2495887 RepID=UPI00148661B2|nr:hypothetical protein [Nonomuraea basaltis]